MDNLTRTISVFNIEETLDYLKCVFGDSFDGLAYNNRKQRIYVRLKNGSSFSIEINSEQTPVFKIEVRRKHTSLKPDFTSELHFNHNTAYVIKYMIKPKLEELWQNLKRETIANAQDNSNF